MNKMNKKALEKYKKKLLEMKKDIFDQYNHLAEDALNLSQRDASGDLSGYTFHMADVATDNYDREFSLKMASTEREIILAIDEALRRIEDGTFGLCQGPDCKKTIGAKRLDALPYAKLCIDCKKKEESKERPA